MLGLVPVTIFIKGWNKDTDGMPIKFIDDTDQGVVVNTLDDRVMIQRENILID